MLLAKNLDWPIGEGIILINKRRVPKTAYIRSLAVELSKYGIRVNGIAPGPVHTGMPVSYITPEMEEQLNKKIPLGRCGQPIDIARAVCFFVSDDAGWITGQVLRVDGGHSWGRCVL